MDLIEKEILITENPRTLLIVPRGANWTDARRVNHIEYKAWNGAIWHAKIVGNTFIHALNGDWSAPPLYATIIQFLDWNGNPYTGALANGALAFAAGDGVPLPSPEPMYYTAADGSFWGLKIAPELQRPPSPEFWGDGVPGKQGVYVRGPDKPISLESLPQAFPPYNQLTLCFNSWKRDIGLNDSYQMSFRNLGYGLGPPLPPSLRLFWKLEYYWTLVGSLLLDGSMSEGTITKAVTTGVSTSQSRSVAFTIGFEAGSEIAKVSMAITTELTNTIEYSNEQTTEQSGTLDLSSHPGQKAQLDMWTLTRRMSVVDQNGNLFTYRGVWNSATWQQREAEFKATVIDIPQNTVMVTATFFPE